MAQITALNVYPVKSCRGIALQSARVTPAGFEHDRAWLVVRPDGRFLTQREQPRLALIETALGTGTLELRTPRDKALADTLSLPLELEGAEIEVTCWKDRCAAFDAGEAAARFLSDFLETPARLVRFDPRGQRTSNSAWTQGLPALNKFSDDFAWLLLSQASLTDLNTRLGHPLPMNRFRPNIVVDGIGPYGEDEVHEWSADSVRLRTAKPCARCIVTTTNQETAERDSEEPLRTLRQYRFSRELKGVLFGQNLMLVEGAGRELAVGQTLAAQLKGTT